jgi:hypothetical protein
MSEPYRCRRPLGGSSGLLDIGGLSACDGDRVPLYIVDADYWDGCVAACDQRYGIVTHFARNQPLNPLAQEKEERQ